MSKVLEQDALIDCWFGGGLLRRMGEECGGEELKDGGLYPSLYQTSPWRMGKKKSWGRDQNLCASKVTGTAVPSNSTSTRTLPF
jgi:hypothetical protein